MSLSIITVVKNDLIGLKKTLASLNSLEIDEVECIVVDGSDEPFRTNETFRFDIKYFFGMDSGIYDAMNIGLEHASGEFVWFLNAGDVYDPNCSLQNYLTETGDRKIFLFGSVYSYKGKSIYRGPRRISAYIWHGMPANHQAVIFSRALIGSLRYDTQYKICSDYYFMSKISSKFYEEVLISKSLVVFDLTGVSSRLSILLLKEPMKIQKYVLKQNILLRCLSFMKRMISTISLIIWRKVF